MRCFGISSPTKLYLQLPISGYSNTAWKTSRVSVKLQSVFQKSPVKIYEALSLHNKTTTSSSAHHPTEIFWRSLLLEKLHLLISELLWWGTFCKVVGGSNLTCMDSNLDNVWQLMFAKLWT